LIAPDLGVILNPMSVDHKHGGLKVNLVVAKIKKKIESKKY
jgi:hypothetical protein